MMSVPDSVDEEYEQIFESRYRRLPVILAILFTVLALIFGIADSTRTVRYDGDSVYIGIFHFMGVEYGGTAFLLWLLIWVAVPVLTYIFTQIVVSPKIVAISRLTEIRNKVAGGATASEASSVGRAKLFGIGRVFTDESSTSSSEDTTSQSFDSSKCRYCGYEFTRAGDYCPQCGKPRE